MLTGPRSTATQNEWSRARPKPSSRPDPVVTLAPGRDQVADQVGQHLPLGLGDIPLEEQEEGADHGGALDRADVSGVWRQVEPAPTNSVPMMSWPARTATTWKSLRLTSRPAGSPAAT